MLDPETIAQSGIKEDSVRFVKEMNATRTREEFIEVIASEVRRLDLMLFAIWLDNIDSEPS